ncbi:MAG TPA: HAD-IIA family hydrolase [Anaerolineaceae bacterium]|nr:HAD-IIA family hydrolase [Anaerolineaceae bacterium]
MLQSKSFLIDMDGVLVSGSTLIQGADAFIERLRSRGTKFLVLTNNSIYTPADLAHRLHLAGLDVRKEEIFTSAMATASFLKTQRPGATAFIFGETGLTVALHDAGFIQTDVNPDYVILGETLNYSIEQVTRAVRLVVSGSHFIATNPDPNGPSEFGLVPACGAMAALIERASGRSPFFIGKPNPLMMRAALNALGVHSEDAVMVGDRMDTDVVAGIQTGMETILVLSGVTLRENIADFPFQPTYIYNSVADIEF